MKDLVALEGEGVVSSDQLEATRALRLSIFHQRDGARPDHHAIRTPTRKIATLCQCCESKERYQRQKTEPYCHPLNTLLRLRGAALPLCCSLLPSLIRRDSIEPLVRGGRVPMASSRAWYCEAANTRMEVTHATYLCALPCADAGGFERAGL